MSQPHKQSSTSVASMAGSHSYEDFALCECPFALLCITAGRKPSADGDLVCVPVFIGLLNVIDGFDMGEVLRRVLLPRSGVCSWGCCVLLGWVGTCKQRTFD